MSNSIQAFFNAIYSTILKKEKSNKTSVEKLASTFGITDKNTIKEITENAIVSIARKTANQSNKTVKQKYDEIVDLYKSQVNLSHRTSQSMLLQQYSTPATIGFLMGIYCKLDQPGNYYEPSAGNGMLTIANSGKDFTVNEIDRIRFQNLKFQNVFKLITKTDSSKETYRSKYFDAIITNPPFATLNSDEYLTLGEYEIKHLDHKMAILALNSMKDNGKAAIIVGGHTSWDDKGRIQAGKNRIFLSYLYKNYNVEDIILIDGNALYSKMGTGFDTRIILINGRKAKAEGFAPLKNDDLAQVIKTTDDLFDRFSQHFEKKQLSSEDFRTQMNKIIDSKLKDMATNKGKALRLRAKALSIRQKQLLQIGQLGVVKSWGYGRNRSEIALNSLKPQASIDALNKIITEKVINYDIDFAKTTKSVYLTFDCPEKETYFKIRISDHSKIDGIDDDTIEIYNDEILINIFSKQKKDEAIIYLKNYFTSIKKLSSDSNVFKNVIVKKVLKTKYPEIVEKYFKKLKIDSTKTTKQVKEQVLKCLLGMEPIATLTKKEYSKSRGVFKYVGEQEFKGIVKNIALTGNQITVKNETGKDFKFESALHTALLDFVKSSPTFLEYYLTNNKH